MSDQHVAIVTGGSRGIGRAAVEALAAGGWRVYFCSKDPASVRAALEPLRETFGDRVAGRPVDVREQDQVEEFTRWVADDAGRIDSLVNNAGLGRFGPVDEISGEDWRETLRTNLDGCFYFLRAVAQVMKRQETGGTILNIASLAARNPFPGGSAYNASKFGLLGLSDAAMLDLRHDGVRVAAILPGSVETEFHQQRRDDTSWMLTPEDVAKACLDILAYPDRALASRIELRPSRPPKK